MKACTKCHTEKPLTDFHNRFDGKFGVYAECKVCLLTRRKANYQKNKDKEQVKIKEYKLRNKERINEYQKQYRDENKGKISSQVNQWHQNNKARHSGKMKQWYQENKEEVLIRVSKYQKENRPRYNAIFKKYKAAKLQAIPEWFEKDKIEKVYDKAQEFNMHVDHIVPLQSDEVCGLHCWHNLQLLDSSLNCAKGNYYWPER